MAREGQGMLAARHDDDNDDDQLSEIIQLRSKCLYYIEILGK